MEVFTLYDLFSLNGTKVAEGHKASFCLEDSECDEGESHNRIPALKMGVSFGLSALWQELAITFSNGLLKLHDWIFWLLAWTIYCDELVTAGIEPGWDRGRINLGLMLIMSNYRYRKEVWMCKLRGAGYHCGLLGYIQAWHRLPVDRHHWAQTWRLHLPGNISHISLMFWPHCRNKCWPLTRFCASSSQIVINPNYEVPETDYSNNIMKCRCRYDGHRVWMYSCHNGKYWYNGWSLSKIKS